MPDDPIIDVPTDSGDEVPAIILPDGTTRRLDRIAPTKSNLLASPTVGETIGVLPRSEWPPTGTGAARVWSPIMNQASHGSCFPPGTKIKMADGSERPIEDVRAATQVLTAQGNIRTVTRTMARHEPASVIRLQLQGLPLDLRMTEEHPVLTHRGYVAARDLQETDMVVLPPVEACRVGQLTREPYTGPVYNLKVTGDESYVAKGVGVHNCTGHGSVSHFMKLRALSGFAHVQLSATYIYAWVNGNRDAGASGSQACKVLVDHGTCTFEECGTETIYRSRIPKSADVTAARYRAFGLLACDSFDELATACIRLGGVAFAVQVGGSFNSLTPEGVAPAARGSGNHWIFADDVVRLKSGEWALEAQNSWGTQWGNNGRMRISETGYNNCGYSDATAFSGVIPDPQAPEEIPPILVESESWPNSGGSEGADSGGGFPPKSPDGVRS